MVKTLTIQGHEFKIKSNAFVLIIYKQLTKRDLMSDLKTVVQNEELSHTTLLNILFSFCYNYDNAIEEDKFYDSIPVNIVVSKEFAEKLINLIKEELTPGENKQDSSYQKK